MSQCSSVMAGIFNECILQKRMVETCGENTDIEPPASVAKHCPQHSDDASVEHRKGQRSKSWELAGMGIESNDFTTVSTCSNPYVIPATVPKEREAPK